MCDNFKVCFAYWLWGFGVLMGFLVCEVYQFWDFRETLEVCLEEEKQAKKDEEIVRQLQGLF